MTALQPAQQRAAAWHRLVSIDVQLSTESKVDLTKHRAGNRREPSAAAELQEHFVLDQFWVQREVVCENERRCIHRRPEAQRRATLKMHASQRSSVSVLAVGAAAIITPFRLANTAARNAQHSTAQHSTQGNVSKGRT
jgi:hypothetical protein